jgi:hypothetical protein
VLRANGDANRALELLEHGRGLIIGYLIDSRGDVSELKDGPYEEPDDYNKAKKLAEKFEMLRDKAFLPFRTDQSLEIQRQARQYRQAAAADLEKCLVEIRKLPGRDRFLLPPLSDDLKLCAVDGPIGSEKWGEHCQTHIDALDSKRCGTITYCYTLVPPAYCPFRLGNRISWQANTFSRGAATMRFGKRLINSSKEANGREHVPIPCVMCLSATA